LLVLLLALGSVLSGTFLASNVWIGGQCGRIWQWNGTTWAEHKSQTDSHIRGMSFVSGTRGYVSGQRLSDTQSVVVKYEGGAQ
jgi:hypothetical protein